MLFFPLDCNVYFEHFGCSEDIDTLVKIRLSHCWWLTWTTFLNVITQVFHHWRKCRHVITGAWCNSKWTGAISWGAELLYLDQSNLACSLELNFTCRKSDLRVTVKTSAPLLCLFQRNFIESTGYIRQKSMKDNSQQNWKGFLWLLLQSFHTATLPIWGDWLWDWLWDWHILQAILEFLQSCYSKLLRGLHDSKLFLSGRCSSIWLALKTQLPSELFKVP